MPDDPDVLSLLQAINRSAEFNRWCGIEVVRAGPGTAEIAMPWRLEVGQYSGFLHAGAVAALIDTACGYAAATLVGANVLAAHFSVNCIPARHRLTVRRPGPGHKGRQTPGLHGVRVVRAVRLGRKAGRYRRDAADRRQIRRRGLMRCR